jgi:hypothetical protein
VREVQKQRPEGRTRAREKDQGARQPGAMSGRDGIENIRIARSNETGQGRGGNVGVGDVEATEARQGGTALYASESGAANHSEAAQTATD